MPFTLNDACFFPFSHPPTPPMLFISWQSYLSTVFPFFSSSFLNSNMKMWINLFCVARGTTSCELQILANTAIYLKWQIRQGNLLDMTRFFELSSFEKVCLFIARGATADTLRMSVLGFMKKYKLKKQD